jgi:hypothetical protein
MHTLTTARRPSSPQVQAVLEAVTVGSMQKVYVYYEDAWWANKLGLMEGLINDMTLVAPFAPIVRGKLAKQG